MSQKLDSFLSIMMQRDAAAAEREAASQARLDNAFAVMQTATAKLDGLIASMMQREADLDVRDYNRTLGEFLSFSTLLLISFYLRN
jgi:hypothetical protein